MRKTKFKKIKNNIEKKASAEDTKCLTTVSVSGAFIARMEKLFNTYR